MGPTSSSASHSHMWKCVSRLLTHSRWVVPMIANITKEFMRGAISPLQTSAWPSVIQFHSIYLCSASLKQVISRHPEHDTMTWCVWWGSEALWQHNKTLQTTQNHSYRRIWWAHRETAWRGGGMRDSCSQGETDLSLGVHWCRHYPGTGGESEELLPT